LARRGAPATKPDVRSRTSKVWPTPLIVPERNASSVLADARSDALIPPGNRAAESCTAAGADVLKPNATDGNRETASVVRTRICCSCPPKRSSWRPRSHEPLSLLERARRALRLERHDGVRDERHREDRAVGRGGFSNDPGARLAPPRSSLAKAGRRHCHAATYVSPSSP
jgi:hypothetical protein